MVVFLNRSSQLNLNSLALEYLIKAISKILFSFRFLLLHFTEDTVIQILAYQLTHCHVLHQLFHLFYGHYSYYPIQCFEINLTNLLYHLIYSTIMIFFNQQIVKTLLRNFFRNLLREFLATNLQNTLI